MAHDGAQPKEQPEEQHKQTPNQRQPTLRAAHWRVWRHLGAVAGPQLQYAVSTLAHMLPRLHSAMTRSCELCSTTIWMPNDPIGLVATTPCANTILRYPQMYNGCALGTDWHRPWLVWRPISFSTTPRGGSGRPCLSRMQVYAALCLANFIFHNTPRALWVPLFEQDAGFLQLCVLTLGQAWTHLSRLPSAGLFSSAVYGVPPTNHGTLPSSLNFGK